MKKNLLFFGSVVTLFVLLSLSTTSFAQIAGTVKDDKGEALVGVSVLQSGTTRGVITDADGNFNIDVKSGVMLRFSSIGYDDIEQVAAAGMSVTMSEGARQIDDVVVIGYGKMSERKLSSSVSTIKPAMLESTPVVAISQGLAGRAPGLIVTQNGGGINAFGSISIRGGGQPLVVINGIPSSYDDLNLINPNDIATFSILKDASATAVYGVRGGNGILLVTTKQGMGKPQVKVSSEVMFTQPTLLKGKMDQIGLKTYDNRISDLYGMPHLWSEEDIEKYRSGDPFLYPNTDWQKETLKKFGLQQRYNVSVQGGTDISQYYLSMGIMDVGTVFKENTNNQQRYNFRFSQTSTIKAIGLKISPSVEGYIQNTRAPKSILSGGIDNYYYYIFSHIQNNGPNRPARNKFGQITNNLDHPLVEMSPESGYHKRNENRLRGQLDFDWAVPWVTGLSLKAAGNYSLYIKSDKIWDKTAPQYNLDGTPDVIRPMDLSKSTNHNYDWTLQYFADYQRTFFEKHTIGATAGYEANYGRSDELWAGRTGYLIPIDQMNSGPDGSQKNSSAEAESGRAGWIGRLKYDYDTKYMVEGSVRYDGSDYFPKETRWGAFWSGSAAWAISQEPFFDYLRNNNIINFAKINFSYGQTGMINPNLVRYAYLSSYSYNAAGHVENGKTVPTFWEGAMPSPDITWYRQNTMDLGLNLTFLKDRLRFSIDWFYMVTKGDLESPSINTYTDPLGFTLPQRLSDAEHRREGFDLGLSWKDNVQDFFYEVGGNFTYFDQLYNRQAGVKVQDQRNPYTRSLQQTGYAGEGYVNEGFYQSSEEIMNSTRPKNMGYLVAGDLKYQDFNGDGKIDAGDNQRIGKAGFPRGSYGIYANLSWKGIYLNILFQGATRADIQLGGSIRGTNGQAGAIYEFQNNFWSPDNREAIYPRPVGALLSNNGNNYVGSDYWYANAAYIRLKTVDIGYDFKAVLLKNVKWLSSLKLGLSGNNLLTFSDVLKYGYDPENASSENYAYPVARTYAISLNFGF